MQQGGPAGVRLEPVQGGSKEGLVGEAESQRARGRDRAQGHRGRAKEGLEAGLSPSTCGSLRADGSLDRALVGIELGEFEDIFRSQRGQSLVTEHRLEGRERESPA